MKDIYYREIEKLPSPALCNIIFNNKLVFDEFVMTTILELVLNKNLKVEGNKLCFKSLENITEYGFDILMLLFTEYKRPRIKEWDLTNIQVFFSRKVVYKYDEDKEYKKIFDLLENNAKKYNRNLSEEFIQIINNLKSKNNIVYVEENSRWKIHNYSGLEFITLCNTTDIEKNVLLYIFKEFINFENRYIELDKIKNLYINNIAMRKINNLNTYVQKNLLIELYYKNIYEENLKELTQKGKEIKSNLKSLKNYIIDYSLLNEKEINDYLLWGEYLAFATTLGICTKIEKYADEYFIQIDDLIDKIKIISKFL